MAVIIQGALSKNGSGRWEIVPEEDRDPFELSSGAVVELEARGKWYSTRIEYDHSIKDYYSIDGLQLYEGREARIQR